MRISKTASDFACRRTQSRWVLNTPEFRLQACQQLIQLTLEFLEWWNKIGNFIIPWLQRIVGEEYWTQISVFPLRKAISFWFFDGTFEFDLCFTLAGLARLCYLLPRICLRLITTDAVESLFSTILSVVGGGGQLYVSSHRWATKRAYMLRLNLFGYIGEGVSRHQALATYLVNATQKPPPMGELPDLILPSSCVIYSRSISEATRPIVRFSIFW